MSEHYESDIEDWICENIATVVGHDDAVLFGRQLRLDNGTVLDVLAVIPGDPIQPVVIEVKRGRIDTEAVVQVLRYMGRLAGGHDDWCVRGAMYGPHDGSEMAPPIGIVAAPDITEKAAMCVHGAANLDYVRIGVQFSATRDAIWDTVDVPADNGELYELMFGVAHQAHKVAAEG